MAKRLPQCFIRRVILSWQVPIIWQRFPTRCDPCREGAQSILSTKGPWTQTVLYESCETRM